MERNDTLPLISVIVPVYKVEPYLRKCVDSILAQTYTRLEVILVDDGSPDNCPAICDEYASQDSRMRVIHKPNGGLSSARNAGLDIAAGEYIGFVDSDDWIAPGMYEKLYEALRNAEADMAVCEMDWGLEPCTEKVQPAIYNGHTVMRKLASPAENGEYAYFVSACPKLYSRELFNAVRFPLGKYHEDQFIAHKVLYRCRRVVKIKDALYSYRDDNDSITRCKFSVRRFDEIEAIYERIFFLKEKDLEEYIPQAVRLLDYIYAKYLSCFHGPTTGEERERLKEIKRMVKLARQEYQEPVTAKQRCRRIFPRLYVLLAKAKMKLNDRT